MRAPISLSVSVVILSSIFLASYPCAAQTADDRAVSASQALRTLFQSYAQESAPYFPLTASENGDHTYDGVLANDLSDDYRAGLKHLCATYRQKLQGIDRAALHGQERLSYDIFEHSRNRCIESFDYPWHLLPVNQVGSSLPSRFPIMGAGKGVHPFKTVRNYEDFLKRIDGFVAWMDTAMVNMRLGIERGITQPRDVMLKVIPQLEAHMVTDPRESLFYEPIKNLPQDFDVAIRQALTDKYLAAIEQKIVPAYRTLRDFIQDEYLPKCRTSYGFSDLPGGRDMYLFAVRQSTTTHLTPEQIYDLGLVEVQRIASEIKALRMEIRAAQDAELTRYHSVADLLHSYAQLRHAVRLALPQLFGRFPTADFEIRPIEAFREKSMPSSYVASSPDGTRLGVFYLNTAALKSGGSATISPSLFLHEAIPGHHLQQALQRENKALPIFRKFAWYNAFGEGWALYAEGLGQEMGIYQNRRERLGMLADELFRAARLVVDVGIHDRGWTRQQAIDYLLTTVGGPPERAEREVERYMAWPGQALGYKIGQLRILDMRQKAAKRLGAAFDIRAFHDELLQDGAMPLDILEAKMEQWIAAQSTHNPKAPQAATP